MTRAALTGLLTLLVLVLLVLTSAAPSTSGAPQPVPAAAKPAAPQAKPAAPVEPVAAILEAFGSHQLVALGDAHGNEQGAAFQRTLIRDPRFAEVVQDIVVEVGNSRHQALMDSFISGQDVPADALRRVWLDTTQQQAASLEMPELFKTVRDLNASRPRERQLRVLLGEPPIDWDKIRTAADLRRWELEPLSGRDVFAADLIRREVLGKQRRALALYGAGHFFRKNVDHSLVSLLEDARATKAFTIWTNAAADMAAMQPDVREWPVPSLARLRGTILGRTDFGAFFGAGGGDIPEQWRAPMEDQFDAVLYLGPASSITFATPARWACSEPAFTERLRRMGLARPAAAERLKTDCVR